MNYEKNTKNFLNLYELNYQSGLEKFLPYIDLAHLKVLKKAKLIPKNIFTKLNYFFLKEIKNGYKCKNYIADDIYQNRSYVLSKKLKYNYEYIHLGRARRDVINTALSIATRQNLIDLIVVVNDFNYQLLKIIRSQKDTIFPDFTYNQKAQPNYLSHYFLSFVFPQLRILDNLKKALDKCLLYHGSIGALNGTSINIDRKTIAKDLKFKGVVQNTRDAMWPIDIYLEISSVITNFLVVVERLINDLIFFNSYNNSYISLNKFSTRNSVIMPQKKNPFTLNMSKACIKELINYNNLIILSNLSQTGQVESRTHVYKLPKKIELTTLLLNNLILVIKGIKFNKKKMLNDANDINLFSTEIADLITIITKSPNRDIYYLIKKIIVNHNNNNNNFEKALSRELKKYDKRIDIKKILAHIKKLNPKQILANRKTYGGASLKSIDNMIKECTNIIRNNKKTNLNLRKYLIHK